MSVLTGFIIPFAGSSAPIGYLLCDGSSHNVSDFANLFAVVGYTYGGSGASFSVPNLTGVTLGGVSVTWIVKF